MEVMTTVRCSWCTEEYSVCVTVYCCVNQRMSYVSHGWMKPSSSSSSKRIPLEFMLASSSSSVGGRCLFGEQDFRSIATSKVMNVRISNSHHVHILLLVFTVTGATPACTEYVTVRTCELCVLVTRLLTICELKTKS